MAGTTTLFSIIEYPPAASNCEILYPSAEDYDLALHLASELRDIGRSIEAVDILNAAMCLNRDFELVTKDKDYVQVTKVRPDFKLKLLH